MLHNYPNIHTFLAAGPSGGSKSAESQDSAAPHSSGSPSDACLTLKPIPAVDILCKVCITDVFLESRLCARISQES